MQITLADTCWCLLLFGSTCTAARWKKWITYLQLNFTLIWKDEILHSMILLIIILSFVDYGYSTNCNPFFCTLSPFCNAYHVTFVGFACPLPYPRMLQGRSSSFSCFLWHSRHPWNSMLSSRHAHYSHLHLQLHGFLFRKNTSKLCLCSASIAQWLHGQPWKMQHKELKTALDGAMVLTPLTIW